MTFCLNGVPIRRPHGHLHPPSWSEFSNQVVLCFTNEYKVVGRKDENLIVDSL